MVVAMKFDSADRRMIGLPVLVVALVILVAAGTGADSSATQPSTADNPRWLLDAAVSVAAVAGLAAVAVLVYAFLPGRPGRRRREEAPEPAWWQKAIGLAISVVLLVAELALVLALRRGGVGSSTTSSPRSGAPAVAAPSSSGRPGLSGALVDWWIVAGVSAGAVAMAAIIAVGFELRRRRDLPVHNRVVRSGPAHDAVEALNVSLDAMVNEPDARRAVIAAYARMESWLARSGAPRRAWEAPFEYLDRVLIMLGASANVASALTELFERAKFSHHPIGTDMRDAAVTALAELRDQLRGT